MIERIEYLRRSIETSTSVTARDVFTPQHQAAIKEWRAHNTLKAVSK